MPRDLPLGAVRKNVRLPNAAGGRLRMGKGPAAPVRFPNRMVWPEGRRRGWKRIREAAGPFAVFGGFAGAEEGAGAITSACCLRARVSAIATGAVRRRSCAVRCCCAVTAMQTPTLHKAASDDHDGGGEQARYGDAHAGHGASSSPISRAFVVPTAWLHVPMATPLAMRLFTRKIFDMSGAKMAPRMPVMMTAATVMDVMPPAAPTRRWRWGWSRIWG